MKHLYILGNWKSNKTIAETRTWVTQLATHKELLQRYATDMTYVLCAPYTALGVLREQLLQLGLPVVAGAQDLSPFVEGAYTGAVSARMIQEVAEYVIIGHSERRKYFQESDEMLQKKVDQAKEHGLKVVYCVPDEKTVIAKGVDIVGYEPVWAIGTGKTDTPENANSVVEAIKKNANVPVVYGGSVVADNVVSFVAQAAIDGVLLGGASLDPEKLIHLIETAATV